MTTEDAVAIAHELARSDKQRIASIGQRLLSLETDEARVLAVKMIQAILPSLLSK